MATILFFSCIGYVIGWLTHDFIGPLRAIRHMHDEVDEILGEALAELDACKALRLEHQALYGKADD